MELYPGGGLGTCGEHYEEHKLGTLIERLAMVGLDEEPA